VRRAGDVSVVVMYRRQLKGARLGLQGRSERSARARGPRLGFRMSHLGIQSGALFNRQQVNCRGKNSTGDSGLVPVSGKREIGALLEYQTGEAHS
jgi:hypothetical protein